MAKMRGDAFLLVRAQQSISTRMNIINMVKKLALNGR